MIIRRIETRNGSCPFLIQRIFHSLVKYGCLEAMTLSPKFWRVCATGFTCGSRGMVEFIIPLIIPGVSRSFWDGWRLCMSLYHYTSQRHLACGEVVMDAFALVDAIIGI